MVEAMCRGRAENIISKLIPVILIFISSCLVFKFRLFEEGVQILGDISNDIIVFNIPLLSSELVMDLAIPACILALIIYVES
jgi:MFS superfamily sulfate permease-like transporter